MPNPDIIGIGPWLPDTPAMSRQPPASTEALNVVARAESYGPFPAFVATDDMALDARVQGAFSVRRTDHISVVYVGTRDKLYMLTGHTVTDVTRTSGGAYSCPENGAWDFAQFGDLVVAFNGVDDPQVINIDDHVAHFAALGGSAPTAKYVTVVGDFLMAGNTATDFTGTDHVIYWSAINNAADWVTSQQTQADNQSLPDGGAITGLVGIEYTCTVFQEFAIRRAVYEGPPDIFRFSVVTPGLGCSVPGSIASYKDMIFFCDRTGFYLLQGLNVPQPIGDQRVNRWFWNTVNPLYLYRTSTAVDVTNNAFVMLFTDMTSTDGTPNHMIMWNWAVDRWTHAIPASGGPDATDGIEFIWTASPSGGWTIEDIAAVYATVELMPYPWDSPFWLGVEQRFIGGFNGAHVPGFFQGAPLPATIDTVEANLIPGRKGFVRSVRPLLDNGGLFNGSLCSVSLLTRDRLNDKLEVTPAVEEDQFGVCQFRSKARYHRARVTIIGAPLTIEQIAAIYPTVEDMPFPWDSPYWGGAIWQDFLGVDDVIVRDAGVR